MRTLMTIMTTLAMAVAIPIMAQEISIKGTVRNAVTNEPVASLSVTIKGTGEGTYTNDKGQFSISTNQKLPLALVFTSIGYESQTITVSSEQQAMKVDAVPVSALGQDVVISATRTPSRILESPVSIERVSNLAIRNTPATDYYDMLGNLKGVDMITSSLTFKTPTTRGFAASGNTRFTQIVAGMNNQAPGLNFSVGSIIGPGELDIESMELLPGASSALYGPGGMNGTLLINTKNPFKYQGLSFQVKEGVMHIADQSADAAPFHNIALRWAQKLGGRFAYKFGVEYTRAKDWIGDDYRDYKRLGSKGSIVPGTRDTDPNYDGIDVYGDETSIDIKAQVLDAVAQSAPFLGDFIKTLPSPILVSRTGYAERDVVDPNAISLKLSAALHYKITNTIEASLTGYWGNGNTVYTATSRYSFKDLRVGQYKLELNAKNWLMRAYTTQENAGESHNLGVAIQLVNEAWKPSGDKNGWYATYGQTYLAQKLAGKTDFDAHAAARAVADQGRPEPNSAQFKHLYDSVRLLPIPKGGLLLDRSDMWMVEGQYNFTDIIPFAEVLAGANWKRYLLKSEGTLFADTIGHPIIIDEYGAYIQVSKNMLNEVLRITASGRYDKSTNFKGRFTPRITALVKVAKDHNIRLSFQTAYRFPSNQQQWIDLDVGTARIIGGVKQLWDKYNMTENPVYAVESLATGSPVVVSYQLFKPESVVSYELGYKALIAKKLLIDIYGYYSQYSDFLSRRDVVQKRNPEGPITDLYNAGKRRGFSVVVNAPGKVKADGFGLSIDYLLPSNFTVGGNFSSDRLSNIPTGFRAQFNSPKYRTNLTFGNTAFGPKNRFGFNLVWRWQDAFYYDSDFASGNLPSINTVDAQVNYKLSKWITKLGATNLLNQYYRNGLGNATVGGMYYLSLAYNVL